jgi:hypothetical protein
MQLIQAVVFSILPLLVLSQHVDHYQQPFNLERCMLRTGAARFSLVANAVSSAAKRFEPGQKGFHNMAFGNAAQHNYAIKQPELKKTVDVAQDAVKHMEKTSGWDLNASYSLRQDTPLPSSILPRSRD